MVTRALTGWPSTNLAFRMVRTTMQGRRHTSSASRSRSRDYNDALYHLSLLQSNRKITNLFDPPSPSSSSPKDLNAAAIPEMLTWLRRAGYIPSDLQRMKHIHVAGTKGKGSVCAFATSILRQYRTVGTFTSPHLISPRERISINGEAVSQELFTESFFQLWDRFTESAKGEGEDATVAAGPESKPFFFRFLTILAWHIFLTQGVKDVVMECGIGGEYDATNVLPPGSVSAAVISQLGIDHVAMLGDTVEKIAWHKAGILKPGVRGFTRRLAGQPSVMRVLRDRAKEKDAWLVEIDDNVVDEWGGVDGRLRGGFQKHNQALALLAVHHHLGLSSDPATSLADHPQQMDIGLREASVRGRGEMIADGRITWFLDGAHTRESLEEVAREFANALQPGDVPVLVFNQQERNAEELLRGLLSAIERQQRQGSSTGRPGPKIRAAVFTTNELEAAEGTDTSLQRALAESMADMAPNVESNVADNVAAAVKAVREMVTPFHEAQLKVLVTGSFHLVGGILRTLEPESLL